MVSRGINLLKVDHVYRVVGPTLERGRSAKKERFEALRYMGTLVPYRNGAADVTNQIEAFYSHAQRHYVLFKAGNFEAEELIS
jgi:hypothetical protein